jgi:hypothetical protein
MKASPLSIVAILLVTNWVATAQAAAPPEGAGAALPESVAVAPDSAGTVAGTDDLLMHRERYFYSSFARRDPFASLVDGEFAATNEDDLLDIGELKLVGVVWGREDRFGVVQDLRKRVHVLRVGDRVVNGKVIEVTQTSLTVAHYFFGETANVTIHMSQGEGDHETR